MHSFSQNHTEPQNGWGQRDLCRSSGTTPPAEAGPPIASGPGLCPDDYRRPQIPPRKGSHQPLWATCAGGWSSWQQKVFPSVQREPHMFQFVPISHRGLRITSPCVQVVIWNMYVISVKNGIEDPLTRRALRKTSTPQKQNPKKPQTNISPFVDGTG